MVWTIIGDGDTQTLLAGKNNFELYALSGSSGPQKLCNFPLLPGTSASSIASAISRASANTHYEPPGETFTT